MIPTRDPAAAAAAPVPLQGEIEAQAAEPAEAVGRAQGRRDLPAGQGGGRQRIGPVAQQQAKPAARLRGERQTACRGEIGGSASLRQLGQDRRQSRTFERLFETPERIARMRHVQDQQPLHGEPEMIEPEPIEGAGFVGRIISLDTEHLPAIGRRQGRDGEPKPEGRAELQLARGRKLMQCPACKTPLERVIEGRHAEPERALFRAPGGKPGRKRNPTWIDRRDLPPELIQRRAGKERRHFATQDVLVLFLLIPRRGTRVKGPLWRRTGPVYSRPRRSAYMLPRQHPNARHKRPK